MLVTLLLHLKQKLVFFEQYEFKTITGSYAVYRYVLYPPCELNETVDFSDFVVVGPFDDY